MEQGEKKRNGWLTTWLVLMLVSNLLVGIAYLFTMPAIKQALPRFPTWGIIVLDVGCILNIVFVIALFKWKKWGIYGLGVNSVVAFLVNISFGTAIFNAFFGFLGLGILALLLRPVWNYFE